MIVKYEEFIEIEKFFESDDEEFRFEFENEIDTIYEEFKNEIESVDEGKGKAQVAAKLILKFKDKIKLLASRSKNILSGIKEKSQKMAAKLKSQGKNKEADSILLKAKNQSAKYKENSDKKMQSINDYIAQQQKIVDAA